MLCYCYPLVACLFSKGRQKECGFEWEGRWRRIWEELGGLETVIIIYCMERILSMKEKGKINRVKENVLIDKTRIKDVLWRLLFCFCFVFLLST